MAEAERVAGVCGMCLFGLPPPQGSSSDTLRGQLLEEGPTHWFRSKVQFWHWITRTQDIGWEEFWTALEGRLQRASYREYAGFWNALSLGWAGRDPEDPSRWRFGVSRFLRSIPYFRSWVMQHELFHAIQDQVSGYQLFAQEDSGGLPWYQCVVIETEAFLFGGPSLGVPLVVSLYGGLTTLTVIVLWTLYEVMKLAYLS